MKFNRILLACAALAYFLYYLSLSSTEAPGKDDLANATPVESFTHLQEPSGVLVRDPIDASSANQENRAAGVATSDASAEARTKTWPVTFWGTLYDENGEPVRDTKCSVSFFIGPNEFGTAIVTSTEGLFDFVYTFPFAVEEIDSLEVAIFSETLGSPTGNGGWWAIDPIRKATLYAIEVPASRKSLLGPIDLTVDFIGISGHVTLNESPYSNKSFEMEYLDPQGKKKEILQVLTDEEGDFFVYSSKTVGFYRILSLYLPSEGKVLPPISSELLPVGSRDITVVFEEQ